MAKSDNLWNPFLPHHACRSISLAALSVCWLRRRRIIERSKKFLFFIFLLFLLPMKLSLLSSREDALKSGADLIRLNCASSSCSQKVRDIDGQTFSVCFLLVSSNHSLGPASSACLSWSANIGIKYWLCLMIKKHGQQSESILTGKCHFLQPLSTVQPHLRLQAPEINERAWNGFSSECLAAW